MHDVQDGVVQRRAFHFELRADGDAKRLRGHASVFDQESENLGGWREVIRPTAFDKQLRDGSDVRALWNHNTDFVLGRTKSGTLRLAKDDVGLLIENDVPDTTWARDLMVTIGRGDVDQMSFAFTVPKGKARWIEGGASDGSDLREVLEVDLWEVSAVTFPAYQQTDVGLRSLMTATAKTGIDVRRLAGILCRVEDGCVVCEADQRELGYVLTELGGLVRQEPSGMPPEDLRRRMRMLEAS